MGSRRSGRLVMGAAIFVLLALVASPAAADFCLIELPDETITVDVTSARPGDIVNLTYSEPCEAISWLYFEDANGTRHDLGDATSTAMIPPAAAPGSGFFGAGCKSVGSCMYTVYSSYSGPITIEAPSLRGVVRSSAAPLPGMVVEVLSASDASLVATATTMPGGRYSIFDLPDGSYKVKVSDPAQGGGGSYFVPQFANGAGDVASAPTHVVSSGMTTDVGTTTLAFSAPGSIGGVVRGDGNVALAGKWAIVGSVDGFDLVAEATTASNGSFAVTGLAPGTYKFAVIDDGFLAGTAGAYLPQLYKGWGPTLENVGTATVVTVTAGSVTSVGTITLGRPHPTAILAGTGSSTPNGDGPALQTSVQAENLATSPSGVIYLSEPERNRVRKLDLAGNVTTFAGTGEAGSTGDGGPATAAKLTRPRGIAVAANGLVYIAEGNRVRRVNPFAGTITTVAGTGSSGKSGDGGPASAAMLSIPSDLALDATGNLYIADLGNRDVRRVDPAGVITTFAGGGTVHFSNGLPATSAALVEPKGIAVSATSLYIAEGSFPVVRKVDLQTRVMSTALGRLDGVTGFNGDGMGAGGYTTLSSASEVAVDGAGNLYVAEAARVRKLTPAGRVTTIAGTGVAGGAPGSIAELTQVRVPQGLTIDKAGNLVIADTGNHLLRRVTAP